MFAMIQMKRTKSADFGDILAALDHKSTERASKAAPDKAKRHDDQIAPEAAARPEPRLRSILGHISWPWRTGAGGSPFATAALYEEAVEPPEAVSISPTKPEPAKTEPPQTESPQTELPQTEDEAIAEELGLHADLAIVDLQRIRRNFAKKNHPDRFAPAQRGRAARRMTIANMLIDEHLKQKPSAQ